MIDLFFVFLQAYHEMGDINSAIRTMENALDTHLIEITSEGIINYA